MENEIKIALVGQPNVGKSSLINAISGAHLKVGNFTGVTVEKAEAVIKYKDYILKIIDLPGIYSLDDFSLEEKLSRNFLLQEEYDVILNVVDSTNLERNLYLTTQILSLNKKMVLALNMADEAKKEGIKINVNLLDSILGVDVVSVSSHTHEGLEELLKTIVDTYNKPYCAPKRIYSDFIEHEISAIVDFLSQRRFPNISKLSELEYFKNYSLRDISIALLKQNEYLYNILSSTPCWLEISDVVKRSIEALYKSSSQKSLVDIFSDDDYSFAKGAATEVLEKSIFTEKNITQKIDSIVLNKYFGIPIFLFLMFVLFQTTFSVGGIGQDIFEQIIGSFTDYVKYVLSGNEFLASLIGDGIIQGVGAVLSFVPLIFILYLGITLLETTGYMARVSFLLDGLFHKFGLHGKSFIPLATGLGCSVPAYMATRVLQNKNERLSTLFVIGFMSCSARLPVYALFVSAFFDPKYAGMILFLIYLAGPIVALFMAKLLKLTVFTGKDEPFVMEMPKYRMPTIRLMWFSIFSKVKMYINKAGTFILLASMLVWFTSQYPKNEELEGKYQTKMEMVQESSTSEEAKAEEISSLNNELNQQLLKQSYIGRIGEVISPVFAPMQYDWQMTVSLLAGLAAKEVVLSTLGVLYSLGDVDEEDTSSLVSVLRKEVPKSSAISFIVFIMFYLPCFAATVVFAKEAGGNKYVAYLFVFTTAIAYIFALLAYYLAELIL